MNRESILELVLTNSQTHININTLLNHLGYEPLTKQEQFNLIESRKQVEFFNQPKSEPTQDMYKRKMNEATTFQTKKVYAELIRGYSIKQLIEDMYLCPY